MTTHDYQPCHLVTITGQYLTPNGTLSDDPAFALKAQRWIIKRHAATINAPTVIIRAA
ncbi:MAG: hypothetical protein ACO3PY_06875 [Pontimonas sp.]